MTDEYNGRLCNERHDVVNARLKHLEEFMDKMRNWVIASLTALALNLLGIGILLIKGIGH